MSIICLLTVVWFTDGRMNIEDRELEGKLIQQNATQLIGDFSGEAKRQKLYGEYSRVKVYKSKCRRD